MDWGAIIQLILAIVGAAAIVGGFVVYRGSTGALVRGASAGTIAAGVMMWTIVLLTVPV